jgi:hypothetical protein
MQDSDSEEEMDTLFERVEPTIPVCLGVDSQFCELIFAVKQALYSDIMYKGDADTQEAQDMNLNNQYESLLGVIHQLLIGVFNKKGRTTKDIPEEVLAQFPPNLKDKIVDLYAQCYQQSNNNDRNQMEHYKLLVDNMFHVYIYDMGSR